MDHVDRDVAEAAAEAAPADPEAAAARAAEAVARGQAARRALLARLVRAGQARDELERVAASLTALTAGLRDVAAVAEEGALGRAAEAARSWLLERGARPLEPDADRDAFDEEAVPTAAAEPGAVLEVVAPAWADASGRVLARGRLRVAAPDPGPAGRAVARAAEAAATLGAPDAGPTLAALGERLAAGEDEGEVLLAAWRALEAAVAAAAAPAAAGRPAAASAAAAADAFVALGAALHALGHARFPAEPVLDPAGWDLEADAVEAEHGRLELVDDPAPPGTVLRCARAAFLRDGEPADGVRAEARVSRGPRTRLETQLAALEASPALAPRLREARAALRERPAAEREGPPGLALVRRLAHAAREVEDDAAAERLLELLSQRGVHAFPADLPAAEGLLTERPDACATSAVPTDAPRGEVRRVLAWGFEDDDGGLLEPCRLEVSAGPPDPLAVALEAVEAVLRRTPVPAGAPCATLGELREGLLSGEPDLGRLAAALASADRLGEADVAAALEPVYGLLGAAGVEVWPPPGADRPGAAFPGAELRTADDPRPVGALVDVERRGFRRGDDVLLAPQVVLSRGPRPTLVGALAELAEGAGPLADLAPLGAELRDRIEAARDAEARGEAEAGAGRAAAVEAAVDLLAAGERAAEGPAELRHAWEGLLALRLYPALAGLDPAVTPFPAPAEPGEAVRVPAKALRDPERFTVDEEWTDAVPRGRVRRVLRLGLRDARGDAERLHPARVVVSLGPKPALEEGLEQLEAAFARPPDDFAAAVAAVRKAARALAAAAAAGQPAEPTDLAQAAAALLDVVEPRADRDDRTARALVAVLDGPFLDGLAELGVEPLAPTTADTQSLERTYRWADAPAGEVLGRHRRGLRVERTVVRPGVDLVSAGPREPLGRVAEAVEPRLAALPDDVREPLAAAVGLEQAIEADRLQGRAPIGAGSPRERTAALVDALEAARPHDPELDRLAAGRRVGEALAAAGLERFPEPGQDLTRAELDDGEVYRAVDGRPDEAPRGRVLAVPRFGLREGGEVTRPAEVVVSLGPDARGVVEALAALDPPEGRLGEVLAALRDPRRDVSPAEQVEALFAAYREADEAARPVLGQALAGLGVEAFPAVGAPAPSDPAEAELRRVHREGVPAGEVLAVVEPGLRRGGEVVHRAVVEVARGPLGPAQKAVAAAIEALPGDGAHPLGAELEAAVAALDDDADDAATRRLAELLGRVEAEGTAAAAAPLAELLAARGYRVLPEGEAGAYAELLAEAGEDAFDPPRRVFGDAPEGAVVEVARRAVLAPDGAVVQRGRVGVAAGEPTALYRQVEALRPGLEEHLEGAEKKKALAELEELQERIAGANADREVLIALPVMNLLQRLDLKNELGQDLKDYLRDEGIKEIIAYPGYDANKLGPARLEEVRVRSDRPRGRIARVLRPGYERTADKAILQKVRAEVSR